MRFEGNTDRCSDCGREISHLDDKSFGDGDPLCSGCSGRASKEWDELTCVFCKKRMGGEKDPHADEDASNWAHGTCFEAAEKDGQLTAAQAEEWSSPADW